MTDQDNTAPAVWDPTARGGAGGWVRRKPSQDAATVHQPMVPPPHVPPQAPPPPPPGSADDQGPPLAARPYLPPTAPPPPAPPAGYGYPPPHPQTAPAPPAAPAAPPAPPGGFPGHAVGQAPHPAFPNAGPAPATQPGFPAAAQPPFPPPGRPPFPQPQQPPQQPHSPQPYQQPYPPQPPQPVGYPGPAEYGDYEEVAPYDDEPRRSRTPLYIALGVAMAVMLGVGVVWVVQDTDGSKDQAAPAPATTAPQSAPAPAPGQTTGGADPTASGSPSTSAAPGTGPNAAAQAKALDDLLSRGESAKAPIGNAVAKVTSCPGKDEVNSAAEVFDAGAKQRDQLIADLVKLDLGDLPGGTETAQTLRTAWQQSGDIDRAYAAWARTVSSQGCTNDTAPSTADLKRANELNPQATQSKKDFVAKWNSLAGTFNLAPRTWDRI
ncbi:hypothetical protein GCM10010193_65220 [Kitasatospora atroaurantiaca]|uniref:Uncharacterized protein n=1 Tax=Kitasatospora atroaurantiaca TaxID=285545 RepID=A0A561EMH5_9ACTN|nr:hypothetical protein [Kitasatospora atroaurantiaca]TWE16817.1 hypothetical protein FB465_1809 [Kitasatospora atroaurantiaca]